MINLRRATIFDHGKILDLCVKWFEEITIDSIPGTCLYTGVWLADIIANGIVIVGELEEKIVGVIMVRFTYMPWNNEKQILLGEALMTDMEHRDTKIGEKLLEAIKEFACNSGLLLILGHITGKDTELKNRWFEINDFKYIGGNFIYKGA